MKRLITSSSNVLGPYNKWYTQVNETDLILEGYVPETEYVKDSLEQNNFKFLGYAMVDPDKLSQTAIDSLVAEGYDLLVIGSTENETKVSLFYVYSNYHISYVSPDEISSLVDSSTSINASMDMGLTTNDDLLCYGYMYEYTKHYDELPDYDTVLDNWDESVSPRTWATAFNRLSAALENVKYYTDNGVQYIELSDNRTWYKIDVPEEVVAEIGVERVQKFYDDVIEWAKEEFYGKTGYDVYLLGRNGRHVCVDDDVQNALRYEYLKKVANDLENDVIFMMNDLSLEDIQ